MTNRPVYQSNIRVYGVVSIFDNDECVTLVTKTGSAVHLPMDGEHSITIHTSQQDNGAWGIDFVSVDMHT